MTGAEPLAELTRAGGPAAPVAARPGVGFGSVEAIAMTSTAGPGVQSAVVPAADLAGYRIRLGDRLDYVYLPEVADGDDVFAATAFALDLEFDDGSLLSDLHPLDQYGDPALPGDQYRAKKLFIDQWNARSIDLSSAHGRVIRHIIARLTRHPDVALTGWLDDVTVSAAPPEPATDLDWVSTRRGSHSGRAYSRGNTVPMVAVPHGGVFGIPMTDAGRADWPYSYHQHNRGPLNRPALEAFATSHLPSPWLRDRGVFQLMPSALEHPDIDRAARALSFRHADETDGPHLYAVTFDNGVRAGMTAGAFALGLRFEFPGARSSIIVDHHGTVVAASIVEQDGTLHLEVELDDREDIPHHFLHVRIPHLVGHDLELRDGGLRGAVVVDTAEHPRIDVLLGISTIGPTEARRNLEETGGWDAMLATARAAWEAKLASVDVEGATADQQRSLYSSLYRVFLYPNYHSERPAGASERYRSPFGNALASPIRVGGPEVRDGVFSANHGFWDTYRTAWPALNLLTPTEAGRLTQGFVEHFADGGWTSRWSAPGAIDIMTGTTSDTVFAAAAVTRVPGVDLPAAYASAVKNATVPAPDRRVGRKGLRPAIFRDYTDTDTDEGMSWTLDNAINDTSIARFAGVLARDADPALRERLLTEREYFARRGLAYRRVFHPELGFFIGRRADGSWRADAGDYDPAVWGYDYTETNGWGTAFTAPHDGAGLAALFGGEEGLGAALDRFFATPETGDPANMGSYDHALHEMAEARDGRLGMLAISNQPAHHIPFMYMFAGRHDDAHRVIAEVRSRLFVGSEIGQGYPGDEDNGEMSAWYLFAALGLYPLVPASGEYVLVPPLLPRVTLTPEGGAPVTITVRNPEEGGSFFRRVWVDDEEWHEISLPHARLAAGVRIDVELSRAPVGWASASRPQSLSDSGGLAQVMLDDVTDATTHVDPAGARVLVDDIGASVITLEPGETVEIRLSRPERIGLYTVTSAVAATAGWTCDWILESAATVRADERPAEVFAWAQQTRPFRPASAVRERVVAVRFTATAHCELEQLEFFRPGDDS